MRAACSKQGTAAPTQLVSQLARCEARRLVDTPVLVTVGPKHPLFFGGVYEPPRVGATDRRPRFRAARGLLA
jgi:hypothetical protein